MKLLQNLGIHSVETHERDGFINGSFAASSVFSMRLLEWSGSYSRERLAAMTFHNEWHNDECPVMQWYDQQRASCTTFRSIEHYRDIHGPFYHEYLLLKLIDGAVCRIERVGAGSRTDAIRYIGCKSHDLIQWFPVDKSDFATAASELIAEVDLGQEFDILDVLAVCYAIQNVKPCSVYTLQRYNCYFLCLTILAVLTRRVASWEIAMSTDTWNSCVLTTLDELSNLSPEELKSCAMLRLCAALDPGNPHSGIHVITTLKSQMISDSRCLGLYKQSMSGTLWHTSWDSEISAGLQNVFQSATDDLLADQTECGNQLQKIASIGKDKTAPAIAENKRLASHFTNVVREIIRLSFKPFLREYEAIMRMREIEHPVPLRMRAIGTCVGPAVSILLVVSGHLSFTAGSNDPLDQYLVLALSELPFELRSMFFSMVTVKYLESLDKLKNEDDKPDEKLGPIVNGPVYALSVLNTLAGDIQASSSDLDLLLGHTLNRQRLAEIVGSFIVPNLVRNLSLAAEGERTRLAVQNKRELNKKVCSVSEFQISYIKQRIQAHADRVEKHSLAAAPLVCMDVERTIERVWKLLPVGFGGVTES